MNILLIASTYPPEIRAISYMIKELVEELVLRGHEITVATSWPQTNLSSHVQQHTLKKESMENNVRLFRIKIPFFYHSNFTIRGISHLLLPYVFWIKLKKYLNKCKIDVVIIYSPPLTLTILGNIIKNKFHAKYLLNIQDIFPQNAIDLGIMKNLLIIKLFEWIEKQAYKNADKITSHTESSRKFLIEKKKIPAEKITTVYNWININTSEISGINVYRKNFGLENKFINRRHYGIKKIN